MAKYVEFTSTDNNKPVIINLDQITSVKPQDSYTEICFVGGPCVWVQEPHYYVRDMLIEKPKPVINHELGSNPNIY